MARSLGLAVFGIALALSACGDGLSYDGVKQVALDDPAVQQTCGEEYDDLRVGEAGEGPDPDDPVLVLTCADGKPVFNFKGGYDDDEDARNEAERTGPGALVRFVGNKTLILFHGLGPSGVDVEAAERVARSVIEECECGGIVPPRELPR